MFLFVKIKGVGDKAEPDIISMIYKHCTGPFVTLV